MVHRSLPTVVTAEGDRLEFGKVVFDVVDEARAALGGYRPFRRFKDALADHPAERERWFAFEADRLRAAAREWLEEHGIETDADVR